MKYCGVSELCNFSPQEFNTQNNKNKGDGNTHTKKDMRQEKGRKFVLALSKSRERNVKVYAKRYTHTYISQKQSSRLKRC